MTKGYGKDIELEWTPEDEILNLVGSMNKKQDPLRLKLGAHGLVCGKIAAVIPREALRLPRSELAPEYRGRLGSCRRSGFESKLVNTKDRLTDD